MAMDFPEQGSVDLIQALVWTNFEREDEEEGGLGLGLDVRWFAVAGLLVLLVWFLWRHLFTVFIGTWSTCSPDGLGRWSKPVGVSFAVGIRG